MKYTKEQIDTIAEKLRSMPPQDKAKQQHTKRESVTMLRGEITALQKRGYSLEQISEALRGEGLDIATPTLRSYLTRAKGARAKTAGAKPKKRTADKSPTPSKNDAKTPGASSPGRGAFVIRPDTEDI